MSPAQDKIIAIRTFRPPSTKEEVRSFLGLVNYVGSFIPDLATISFPLRELIKDKSEFKWEANEQNAFDQIMGLLGNVNTLSHFDPKLKTRLVADASPVGLGAVLLQYLEGSPKVVAYASKSLTDTERRYAQTEKEALALVWAVERFRIYLLGIRFELETDHKPLEAIFSPNSSPCIRIERWVLRMQAFSYDVVYRKGKSNIADPLSRLSRAPESEAFDPDSDVYIRSVMEVAAVDIEELESASATDPVLCELRGCLNRGIWNYTSELLKPFHAFRNELGTVGNLIVRGSRLIVPTILRPRMLQLGHEGHPGRTKMQQRLRSTCWWPGMDESIIKTVDSCAGCRIVSQADRPEPMQRRKLPEAPWIDLAMDFLGPLPSGDHLLVVIDYFSRYKEVEVLRKITATETIDRLESIFTRLGYPRTITLDNGRQFVSTEFEQYCKQRGIVLNRTTPYWPQENGLVERQNRSLVKRLKISQALKQDWKRDILTYLSMYYSTPHSTTGKTPSELMYGRNVRTKLPSLADLGTAVPSTDYRDRDHQAKEKGKIAEDHRRGAKPSSLEIGDKVHIKRTIPGNKLSSTFNSDVLTVTAKRGPRTTIQNDETGKVYERNSSHLKKIRSGNDNQNDLGRADEQNESEVLPEERQEDPLRSDDSPEQTSTDQDEPASEQRRVPRLTRVPNRFADYILDG
ncbi:uncharacterized protein K02A2.6-like isoform X1 [Aedes albopictus]|uniref:RNA-directed DNA polymerase n=1 Tax=Aedes albopictus TaxID=7160 RepID=A0ABM1XL77_AEDAL